MIDVFDNTARVFPRPGVSHLCRRLRHGDVHTYRQARVAAAAMARRLQDSGVRRGDAVVVDLPNCPEFAFLALAAGYGSFSLVTLNQRLSEAEKSRAVARRRAGESAHLLHHQLRTALRDHRSREAVVWRRRGHRRGGCTARRGAVTPSWARVRTWWRTPSTSPSARRICSIRAPTPSSCSPRVPRGSRRR